MSLSSRDFVELLDGLLEGLQVVDHDLRYLHVNDAAARHGRSSRDALLGRTMIECYPSIEGSELHRVMRRCLDERSSHLMENAFTFPDGAVGHFELRIEPVPQGASVLSLDITERKAAEAALARAEERLAHAERMEAIGTLAAGVAHDFNNLLTLVLGEGERALSLPEGPTRSNVETMMAAARTSSELTRQLLAVGQRSVLERTNLQLAEVLTGLERFLRPALAPRIELRVDLSEAVACVEADRAQLEQIVLNLVFNARDAIVGEGQITIALSAVDLDDSITGSHPGAAPGTYVVLGVSDTGVGMDAATQKRIFEPFFTTKERGRGTGMGLAMLYGIVQQHRGNVWVYSELGKGTTFKVYLPAAGPAVAPRARSIAAPPVSLRPSASSTSPVTVLVAEDTDLLRRLFENVLRDAGYRVLIAASGEEAAGHWDREADEIGLLITDAVMPGMSGADLIEHVRARAPELPVICTSGYGTAHLRERAALAENITFVEKPFSPKKLVARVRELLASGLAPSA